MRFVIWRAELMPTQWRSEYVGLQQKFQNLIRYSLASRYTGILRYTCPADTCTYLQPSSIRGLAAFVDNP